MLWRSGVLTLPPEMIKKAIKMKQQEILYPKISFCITTINWSYGGCSWIDINATAGCSFYVNWGDGKQERFIGKGSPVTLTHDYFPKRLIPEGGISFHVEIFSNDENCRITKFCDTGGEMIITKLDTTNCVELEELIWIMMHEPITLDLSKNTALRRLNCNSAMLSELDLSNNTELVDLDCRYNELKKLDLSNNKALRYLDCRCNNLLKLDVSNNTELVGLNCRSNGLKKLYMANNKALQYLNCSENEIEKLDLSHNPALQMLNCTCNKMSELVLGADSQLSEAVFIEGNHIDTEKEVTKSTEPYLWVKDGECFQTIWVKDDDWFENPWEEKDRWYNKGVRLFK
jgi:hypothetical protein